MKFRESHHHVARLFALGHDYTYIAQVTGYSYQRIMQYANDPAFMELIASKRALAEEEYVEKASEIQRLNLDTMLVRSRQWNDKVHVDQEVIDETGEFPPVSTLRADFATLGDRFGYPKTQINQNEIKDFAKMLAERRKFHEGQLAGPEQAALPAPGGTGEDLAPSAGPLPFKRRI